jgi:hypothetical protein
MLAVPLEAFPPVRGSSPVAAVRGPVGAHRDHPECAARLERVELTNYRSFGPGTTVIEFPDQENIVALVGANNAGKSNLLSAVRLALGGGRRDAGDPSDFHQLARLAIGLTKSSDILWRPNEKAPHRGHRLPFAYHASGACPRLVGLTSTSHQDECAPD